MAKKARRRSRNGILAWAAIAVAMLVAVGLVDHATANTKDPGDPSGVAAK